MPVQIASVDPVPDRSVIGFSPRQNWTRPVRGSLVESSLQTKVCGRVLQSTNSEDRTRRIRELCAGAAATQDPHEAKEIAIHLRTQLHAHITYPRDRVAMYRNRASPDDDSEQSECACDTAS
jgi:hypothetical protein